MRNVSNAFKTALSNDNRNYQCTVTITLANNAVLTVTNAELWQGGLSMEDAVSQDSAFEALGSVAINSLNVILNNINDTYSDYDFTNAKVVASVSLTGVSDVVKLGEFIVDSTNYNGSLITLYCLDNMSKFDKPYSGSSLTYPATLQSIVTNACTDCGVTLNTTTFPNYTYQIATRPTDEALTYREIVSYAAIVAGCFARINSNGALELKWFDTTTLSSLQTTINNNNGTLNPQNVSASVNAHRITALSSQDMSIEDVVITGIQIITKSDDTEIGMETHLYGLTGYVIKIENNPFITSTNVGTIGNYLSSRIVGLRFRKATVEHLSDPSIEAGDIALVWDRKNNVYTTLVTGTSFGVGKRQRTTSAAESPLKNSATRFTSATKTYVESLQFAQKEATLREQMEEDLTEAINAKSGMYETRVQEQGGGYTYYLHDKPLLAESAAVLKITNEAVAVTPNYQAQTPTWYGLTVDGNFIANIMSVIGIDFDWGTGGTLVLGGQNNVNGSLTIKNASNATIGSWDNAGITATKGSVAGFEISENELKKSVTLEGIQYDAGISSVQYVGPLVSPAFFVRQWNGNVATEVFEVDYDGGLYARSGSLSGIEFNNGQIGAFSQDYLLTYDYIYLKNAGNNDRYLEAGTYTENGPRVPYWLKTELRGGEITVGTNQIKIYTELEADAEIPSGPKHEVGKISFAYTNGSKGVVIYKPYGLDVLNIEHGDSSKYFGLAFNGNKAFSVETGTIFTINVDSDFSGIKFCGPTTITGTATLESALNVTGLLKTSENIHLRTDVQKGTTPSAQAYRQIIWYDRGTGTDTATNRLGNITCSVNTSGANQIYISVYEPDATSTANYYLSLLYPKTGSASLRWSGGEAYFGDTTDSTAHALYVRNSVASVALYTSSNGNHGLYSATNSAWMFYHESGSTDIIIPHTTRIINGSLGVNKTGGTDGNAGFWANAAGNLYLTGGTNAGSAIYFYYNKATSATSNITETASGRLTASNTFNAATIGSGKKTAYNDGNAGVWLQSVGNIDISNASGGAIQWHYANSTNATSTITETTSGVLTANGSFVASGLGVNKTSGQDGNAGFWANASGNLYLTGGTGAGGYIYFFYNKATSSTSYIRESASGELTINAYLVAKDYSGSSRRVVTSYATDGQRVASFGAVGAQTLYISGQWSTTGTTYTSKTITVSSSDIRLKEHIKPSTVSALNLLEQIKIREFDWKDGRADKHQKIGMVADEIEKLDPLLSVGGGTDESGGIVYKSVDTFYLVGYLVKAIQELYAEVKVLKGE